MSTKTEVRNSQYFMQLDEEYGAHKYNTINFVIRID